MTDSHAHLTNTPIKEELDDILKQFITQGGKHILDCAYDLKSSLEILQNQRRYDIISAGKIKISIGIHPEEYISHGIITDKTEDSTAFLSNPTFDSTRKLISEFERLVRANYRQLNAIGETGLDYYWLFKDSEFKNNKEINEKEEQIEMQKMSFIKHIELALEYNLPLTIHSRELKEQNRCIEDTLKIISESGKGNVKGCMHSYTGSINYIEDILNLGFMIGFNAIITYKNAQDVREIVKQTPLDRILLETDCPLLALRKPYTTKPQKYGYPYDVYAIAQCVADIKGLTKEDVIYQTDKNFESIFLRN